MNDNIYCSTIYYTNLQYKLLIHDQFTAYEHILYYTVGNSLYLAGQISVVHVNEVKYLSTSNRNMRSPMT